MKALAALCSLLLLTACGGTPDANFSADAPAANAAPKPDGECCSQGECCDSEKKDQKQAEATSGECAGACSAPPSAAKPAKPTVNDKQ